ncbi:MAG: sodium:proton antiporter [Thermogutta sp.]|nr:sodium:proton antiporter [Thermogutta sp.]
MDNLAQLVMVLSLGIAAQWAAWRLHVPAIILLLSAGILAGPFTGVIEPDLLLGDLLMPTVSLAVAVILFEGGLNLKFRELRQLHGVFLRLMTLGVAVTWAGVAAAARLTLGLSWPAAILIGAVLTVTGPTVIGPLLRSLRLRGRTAAILKWEGIVVDPLGSVLAVAAFQFVQLGEGHGPWQEALRQVAVSGGVGLIGGAAMTLAWTQCIRRHWIPDFLQSPAALGLVALLFAIAARFGEGAGLLAVTAAGIGLANSGVPVRGILEFKENLAVVLVSSLFIILGARLPRDTVLSFGLPELLFVLLLLCIRPAAVMISTLGSSLTWRERVFLGAVAPRGIVAAAVISVFALQLERFDSRAAAILPSAAFTAILGTVTFSGLIAGPLARRLRLVDPNPQGTIFVGGYAFARALAKVLRSEGFAVLIVDTDRIKVAAARMEGLPVYHGSAIADRTIEELDFSAMRRVLALTPNDELNSLACLQFSHVLGRREVYQLPYTDLRQAKEGGVPQACGRFLFDDRTSFTYLAEKFGRNVTAKVTRLSAEFDFQAYLKQHGDSVLPVLLIRNKEVTVFAADERISPHPGDTIVALCQEGKTFTSQDGHK